MGRNCATRTLSASQLANMGSTRHSMFFCFTSSLMTTSNGKQVYAHGWRTVRKNAAYLARQLSNKMSQSWVDLSMLKHLGGRSKFADWRVAQKFGRTVPHV